MQDTGGNRCNDQASENQRCPPTRAAALDAPRGDDRLPRRQRNDRVAARRVDDERRARRCGRVEERHPAGGKCQAKQGEEREVRPAPHRARGFLTGLASLMTSRSGIASSDSRRRSASVRSRSTVRRLGTTTQKSPAAFAACTPLVESSKAIASAGETPSRSSAVMYRSGSGLVRFTSSRHTMASKWLPIPKRLRWSITHLRVELDATAVLSPSSRAATRQSRTPGNSCCRAVASW